MSRKTHAPGTRAPAADPNCYCGGGPGHPWKPNGGGNRILACPSHAPIPRPVKTRNRNGARR